ncbi:MAG: hypothetical protein PHW90_03625, partial [Bacilli bacterium]|nr:hypothetical protein [Bacilli bacterium]
MKKFNLAVLLFVTMFFIAPSNVNGFPGGYAYDVNELLIETAGNRKYIVIDGWAAIDDNVGNLMNNINPKYTLKLIGMDASGKKEVVTSAIYSNVAPVGGGFTEPGSTPRDYTKAWYSKMRLVANDKKSPSPSYPNEANSNRGRYVCLTYSRGNRFYINIDFKFRIPLEDIRIILRNNNVDGVYFRLTVETVKGEHTVFGFPRGENKQTEEPKCKRT